ncbi:MAG: hypothetical protein ACI8RZ_005256 [Myxococcota bacterium]|jgi:hypothetical protein
MRTVLMMMAAGCSNHSPPTTQSVPPASETAEAPRPDPFAEVASFAETVNSRGAVLPRDDAWGDTASTVRYLDQNWGPIEGLWFYYASQGSRLILRDVLLNLELADSEARLASVETFTRYRFLAQAPTPNNPDGLPVGFARDGEHVGLTCAACHTGQILYGDTAVRIDGAPAMADLPGLLMEIEAALRATLDDPEKQARFIAAVGANSDADAEAETILSLEQSALFFESYTPAFTEVVGGYGRLDAIGGIVNQAIRFTSGTDNAISANAPTSYPVLWDAPRHDYLQWTGFSANSGPGSIARNVGEVVGVFGEIHATGIHSPRENRAGFSTSIKAHNLVDMEETLWTLQSPLWPEDVLPTIDRALAEQGAALYAAECASCHAIIDRDDDDRRVVAQVIGLDQLGTDPLTATNLADARLPTGILEGSLTPDGTGLYGAEAPAMGLIEALVANSLKENKTAAIRTLANAKRWGLEESPKQGSHTPDSEADPFASLRAYKARPLNGAWASAPYLHNGSVPTLYDLLLPEAERPARFAVGSWRFDPVRVGFVSEGSEPWVLDTTIPGNQNTGHRYGTTLSDDKRWALVEYLKTL